MAAVTDIKIVKHDLVPEGQIFQLAAWGMCVAAPLTHWSLRHEGRWPLLSRYSPGMIELARERRRRANG